jgi:DNA-directed RNA polymerase subunit RPC12/RpoP
LPRSDFNERSFTCSICGERFTALTGDQPVRDPVCTHCGLRYSPEQRRRLTEERKKKLR